MPPRKKMVGPSVGSVASNVGVIVTQLFISAKSQTEC